MKTHFTLYTLLAACLTCFSCQEQDMMHYDETPAIYFANEALSVSNTQADSISHTFFVYKADVTRDTVRVLIRAMGMPVDYDRPVKLVQINAGESDAAVAGTHYVAFDDPAIRDSFYIPAGEVSKFIPIVLLRDQSLASSEVRLSMELEANEHFRQGIDDWRMFLVKTTDEATKPDNWDKFWYIFFGSSWGTEKMRLIIQSTGLTDFVNTPDDTGYLYWLRNTASQALEEYNAAHPDAPLCEADGTPVTFEK